MPPDGRSRRQTFQFTPLREGRLCGFPTTFALQHFNSRPSARGDYLYDPLPRRLLISIHAPPRGATALYGYNVFYQPTFQFTPLREGRREKGAHMVTSA